MPTRLIRAIAVAAALGLALVGLVALPASAVDGNPTISGRVVDVNGDPIANVFVSAGLPDGTLVAHTNAATAADGTYSISAAPGSYRIYFLPGGTRARQWWGDVGSAAESTAVSPAVGANVTGVDATITPGLLVDSYQPAFVYDLSVYLRAPDGTWNLVEHNSSGSVNQHVFGSLRPGAYVFKLHDLRPDPQVADAYWPGVPDLAHATVYNLTTSQRLPDITVTPIPHSTFDHDFNQDGDPDIAYVTAGALWVAHGDGHGGIIDRSSTTTNLVIAGSRLVVGGDLSGGTNLDLLAIAANGTMTRQNQPVTNHTYGVYTLTGSWKGYSVVTGVDDFNGDGLADLLVRDSSGRLLLAHGDGTGGFAPTLTVSGSGWGPYTAIFGAGDLTGDGKMDLVARDPAGALWIYPGLGNGGFKPRIQIGSGWGAYTVTSVGDFNGDGHGDIVARDSGGKLWLYPTTGLGKLLPRTLIGTGWAGVTIVP